MKTSKWLKNRIKRSNFTIVHFPGGTQIKLYSARLALGCKLVLSHIFSKELSCVSLSYCRHTAAFQHLKYSCLFTREPPCVVYKREYPHGYSLLSLHFVRRLLVYQMILYNLKCIARLYESNFRSGLRR